MAKRKGSAGNSARRKKSTNKYSRRSGSNKLGTLCIILQTIDSIALMAVLYLLGMIPDKYLILVAAILFFLWCVTLNSQAARRKRGTLGKVFSLLMAVVMFTGSYYVAQASEMEENLTVRFRVGDVYKNKAIVVYFDDQLIGKKKRQVMAPGEMEQVILKKKKLEEYPETKKIMIRIEEA